MLTKNGQKEYNYTMKKIIITNNPRVYDEFFASDDPGAAFKDVRYLEGASQEEILISARDLIHLGGRLLIHPMMGRIKPHETPYKSVLMEIPEGGEISAGKTGTDTMSVVIIEDSLAETKKLLNNTYGMKYSDEILRDLQYIDMLLIKSGAEECR